MFKALTFLSRGALAGLAVFLWVAACSPSVVTVPDYAVLEARPELLPALTATTLLPQPGELATEVGFWPTTPPVTPPGLPEQVPSVAITPTPTRRWAPPPTFTPWPTRTPLPEHTSDLLYLSDERLMRWDHVTGYAVTLAEGVAAYTASADGRRVALLRAHNVAANGVALYDLDLLDFSSGRLTSLAQQVSRMYGLAFSPNAAWIAYTSQPDGGQVQIIPGTAPGEALDLGACQQAQEVQCAQLVWSPDSRSILWSSADGLWLAEVEKRASRLVHPAQVEVIDPKGETTRLPVAFNLEDWSPAGRYVLVQVLPSANGVRWKSVLDTRLGRLTRVPGSDEMGDRLVGLTWTSEGGLLLANGGDPAQRTAPFVQLWSVVPTSPEMFISVKFFELHSLDFPPLSSEDGKGVSYCLGWLAPRPDGLFGLGMLVPGTTNAAVLFELELEHGRLKRLLELPYDTTLVTWSPDGRGALVQGSHTQVLFADLEAGRYYDLRPMLGDRAHSFTWLPPARRA
ncbi:MAG: hypothetical protein AB1894_03995 [Chloroflexota bacterium]